VEIPMSPAAMNATLVRPSSAIASTLARTRCILISREASRTPLIIAEPAAAINILSRQGTQVLPSGRPPVAMTIPVNPARTVRVSIPGLASRTADVKRLLAFVLVLQTYSAVVIPSPAQTFSRP
jgi:hypothetical protein